MSAKREAAKGRQRRRRDSDSEGEGGAGVAQLPLRDATQLYAKKKYVKFMNMNEADGYVNCDSDSDCDANVLAQLLLLLHKLHVVCRPRHVWATKLLRETGPNVINTSRHRRRTRL